MKLEHLLVYFLILASPVVVYAQPSYEFQILLQTQVRDSYGNLAAYIESTRITILDRTALNSFLDSQKSFAILLHGHNFDAIQIKTQNKIQTSDVISTSILAIEANGKYKLLAFSGHNGFPVVRGDTVTTTWLFIRQS